MSENGNIEDNVENDQEDYIVVKNLLHEVGIDNYEDGVITQLLYLTYDYVTSIMEDAIKFSRHANKTALDTQDVKLALNMYDEKHPDTKYKFKKQHAELLMKINEHPLPEIKSKNTLKIPVHNTLSATNYKLKQKENEQIHYIYNNENCPILVTTTSQQSTDPRTLLKRPTKMYSTPPQKIVFRPNFNFKYVTNSPLVKKKKEN